MKDDVVHELGKHLKKVLGWLQMGAKIWFLYLSYISMMQTAM